MRTTHSTIHNPQSAICNPQSAIRIPTTLATLAGLYAASSAYNRHIERSLRSHRHLPGSTALQVVAGVAYTLAGALALLAIWTGRRNTLRTAAALVAAFSAAGLPMLLGDIDRDL